MSFSDVFRNRWKNVIEPAVGRVAINEEKLKAHRVDTRTVSDSILTEILTGISRSRLVLADITTIGTVDDKPVRNGNVLYEVGLAQAVRLPEEVLLFRSDNDPLLFDVSNIRVNKYDPDKNPKEAQETIIITIISALKEVDLKKHLTVQRLAESLDYPSWWALVLAQTKSGISHPEQKTMGQMLGSFSQSQAISRLLEIGAFKTQYQQVTPELIEKSGNSGDAGLLMRYECTELGSALFNYALNKLDILQPEMVRYLKEKMGNNAT
ncbi:MAG: hypothetical protein P8098_05450, partial [Candidatus Thiodiazotropha sp.]